MQTKQIHVKATCENENRRFCVSEAKFETLKQTISNIFSIEIVSELVVKYKDDENDLVTISSDEELTFAVNLFPTDILRLVIEVAPQKSSAPVCANDWHKKERCEKRGHFLHAKRERVLAALKELEGSDFQDPKLSWKQEHLKRKLQNLDAKIAYFSSAGPSCQPNGRGYPGCAAPSEDRHCHFLAMKKEKIVARLKELEGTDFQANPGLQWKKDRLEEKLRFLEAKLANKEAGPCPGFGGRGRRFHGPSHRGYHGPNGRGSFGYQYPMGHHGAWKGKRCHNLAAKKEWLEARLKELEGTDFSANPGLLWKQEHLKRKLQKIETKLSSNPTGMENGPTNLVNMPQPTDKQPTNLHKDEVRRMRESLKQEKQAAIAKLKGKREAYHSAKRFAGDQGEELAKLQEEFMKAKEEAFQKKRALKEFKAKNCAGLEDY